MEEGFCRTGSTIEGSGVARLPQALNGEPATLLRSTIGSAAFLLGISDILAVYVSYCDIASGKLNGTKRHSLDALLKSLDFKWQKRDSLFNDLGKLMSYLNMSVDSRQFNCFYDFVFLVCRENGQKSITVNMAITAWRLVLTGRFRLVNQWCDFVEKCQRHNISEDTWQQVLCFSRSVNEDLDGYDPKGAWPVLIDDFVEHMYRINQPNKCNTRDCFCGSGDIEAQPSISNIFGGLNLHPGSKRKFFPGVRVFNEAQRDPPCSSFDQAHPVGPKRPKSGARPPSDRSPCAVDAASGTDHPADVHKCHVLGCLSPSAAAACSVEDGLAKVLEGHLSMGCCFQFDKGGLWLPPE